MSKTWENSDTKDAANNLENSVRGFTNDGFGDAELPDLPGSELKGTLENTHEAVGDVAEAIDKTVADVGSNLVGAFTDADQYLEVADAAGASALNYISRKIERIKKLWNTPVKISVKSLLGEVAPYASSIFPNSHTDGMLGALADKTDDLFRYLLDFEGEDWDSMLEDLGKDAISSILSDESVSASIADLDAVKAFANTINGILNALEALQNVLKVLEPIMPMAEIIADFAITFWSGGTSAASATNKTAQQVEALMQRITSASLEIFRKYVYNIKLTLPALLVDSMSIMSIKDEFKPTTGDDKADKWLNAMFSEDFYQNDVIGYYQNNVNNEYRFRDSVNKAKDFLNDATSEVKRWGDLNFSGQDMVEMKGSFLKNLTMNFMKGAIKDARNQAGLEERAEEAWKILNEKTSSRISASIISSKKKFSNKKSDLDLILESSNVMRLSDFDELTIRTLSKEVL